MLDGSSRREPHRPGPDDVQHPLGGVIRHDHDGRSPLHEQPFRQLVIARFQTIGREQDDITRADSLDQPGVFDACRHSDFPVRRQQSPPGRPHRLVGNQQQSTRTRLAYHERRILESFHRLG